jgi:hypothetical protein
MQYNITKQPPLPQLPLISGHVSSDFLSEIFDSICIHRLWSFVIVQLLPWTYTLATVHKTQTVDYSDWFPIKCFVLESDVKKLALPKT